MRAPDWSGAAPTDGDHGDTMACIRAHESDSAGGYSAVNSSSGAGGAYQALPSTWDGYGGYAVDRTPRPRCRTSGHARRSTPRGPGPGPVPVAERRA